MKQPILVDDDDDISVDEMTRIRNTTATRYGWQDRDGYFRCNSWLCDFITCSKTCYGWHSAFSHCLREFVKESKWYEHITWSDLFDHITDDCDSVEDFCDCYHVLMKAIDNLPTKDATDEENNVFDGLPVSMTSEYMNIKAQYLKELSALTDLVDNNSPDKVSFVLSGQILASEIYFFQKYATLHYTPYSTSIRFIEHQPEAKRVKTEY